MSDRPDPVNVVEAIARVKGEIGGIEKITQSERRKRRGETGQGESGVSYAYRSIDDITSKAQELEARYGLICVPEQVEVLVIDHITKGQNASPWTDTKIKVTWRWYGPGGVEDCIRAESIGQGQDNADKGMNKAMTSAHKNLLIKTYQIGDAAEDTDNAPPPPSNGPPERPKTAQERKLAAMFAKMRDKGVTGDDRKEYIDTVMGRHVESSKDLTMDELGLVLDALNALDDVTEGS